MVNRHTPPGRTSISRVVVVNPSGPHHLAICLASVHAANTRSRGASTVRVMTISRSAVLWADGVEVTDGSLVMGGTVAAARRLSRRKPRRSVWSVVIDLVGYGSVGLGIRRRAGLQLAQVV